MDVKNIIFRINKLSYKEKNHILNILKANDIEYTKNINGYFFNFLKINDSTVDKIIKCLELIEKNCNLIKEMDKRRNDLIKHYKIIIEEKLKTSFEKRKNEYIKYLSLQTYETNIYYDIKRVNRITRNKKFLAKTSNQAELILKEYQKSQTKFIKNSVYHRIYSTIRMNKRYIETKTENEPSSIIIDNYNDDNLGDIENIENIEEIEDIDNIEEVDNMEEPDNIEEVENIEDIDHLSDYENKTEIYDDEDSYSNNSDESDNENKTSFSKITTKAKQKIETDISYYKSLLYQQGFVFDDNKRCLLIRESYIV